MIARGSGFSHTKDSGEIPMGVTQTELPNTGGIGEIGRFSTTNEFRECDAVPPKSCARPPRSSASTTVLWRSDTAVSSTVFDRRKFVYNIQAATLVYSTSPRHGSLHDRYATVEPLAAFCSARELVFTVNTTCRPIQTVLVNSRSRNHQS